MCVAYIYTATQNNKLSAIYLIVDLQTSIVDAEKCLVFLNKYLCNRLYYNTIFKVLDKTNICLELNNVQLPVHFN